ncbi:MAG: ribose-phosphate pyrophosphokinase-like domain-containing protein, partial [Steroidobacteraceae bacterium]
MELESLALFSGTANAPLAHDIARHLRLTVSHADVGHFSDGETSVEIMENVRGRDVFIVQPTCP